jgi:hypothetical protein
MAGSVAITGCVTSGDRVDAVLSDSASSTTRSALRVAVRDDVGRSWIIDPDSLLRAPELELRPRLRSDENMGPDGFMGEIPAYRLQMDGQRRCWLVRDGSEDDATLLPRSTRCSSFGG